MVSDSFDLIRNNSVRDWLVNICLFAARKAFQEVGKLLQKRRKADLYEMVQYFTANQNDPAGEDPSLKSKLEENQKHYSKRMDEVIDK